MRLILHQLYSYTASLDKAVLQLCNIRLPKPTDSAEFHSFCTTTILASNQKDSFHDGNAHLFPSKLEESLRSIVAATDKQGVHDMM